MMTNNDLNLVPLETILDYEQPGKYIVRKPILDEEVVGSVPVLTANNSFILGYTLETKGVYKNPPVIIFDDFTTKTKFVNFSFKVKSSAMKILTPKMDGVDIKYVYYMMKLLKINSTSHKRYYLSVYQKIKVPLPSLDVQKKIVSKLEHVESIIKKREETRQLVDEYAKSLFYEMFGDIKNPKNKFQKKPFEKCIEKEASKNWMKIKNSDFKDVGCFPIIDQGTQLIAGYTDDEQKIYDGKLPVILFGDHTRAIKYVDFPFALGADGVKILVPRSCLNPIFFCHSVKYLFIPSKGYSRHYKFLKNEKLIIPPIDLQQDFVDKIKILEEIKECQDRSLQELNNLLDVLMYKAFQGELEI